MAAEARRVAAAAARNKQAEMIAAGEAQKAAQEAKRRRAALAEAERREKRAEEAAEARARMSAAEYERTILDLRQKLQVSFALLPFALPQKSLSIPWVVVSGWPAWSPRCRRAPQRWRTGAHPLRAADAATADPASPPHCGRRKSSLRSRRRLDNWRRSGQRRWSGRSTRSSERCWC